jgi:4-carboxymuconolactone decarboxylase
VTRLPLLPPARLTAEQKALYDEMRRGIASAFNGFEAVREDGALMGPWNPYLHEPAIGKATWALTNAIRQMATLHARVREIAILVVGARYDAAFEIYAHVEVGERVGIAVEDLATISAGLKPTMLAADESIGYDLAHALCNRGTLPEPLYRLGLATFGQRGIDEMIYLVGLYSMIAITLNAFDVPVPEHD